MAQAIPVAPVPLPYLPENSPASCPVSVQELLRYVRSNAEGARHVCIDQLVFVRTARIEDCGYWLWRFPAAGLASYALVMQDAEGPWLTCHQSLGGMAPEDVLIADYRTASGNP
jgi:hypothetical protein